jgi:hypothetical protein
MIRPTTLAERSHRSTPIPSSPGNTDPRVRYGIKRPNKAHTATANRIARRLNTQYNQGDGFDIRAGDIVVEVETTATMAAAEKRLSVLPGHVYIAMTNKDGVEEALLATAGSRVGIMDPHGNIVRESIVM